jgi:hypothetical protein
MQAGVPQALRRAALARIWSLDPAIRDFREMADYDWDFNTPGGAPGYGPLRAGAEEIERWLARILPPEPKEPAGGDAPLAGAAPGSAADPRPDAAPPGGEEDGAAHHHLASPSPSAAGGGGPGWASAPPRDQAAPEPPDPTSPRPRRHGSAVPS